MKKAFIFLAPGFEEIEAVTPIDVLRRAGVDVQIISISSTKKVIGSHGIEISADHLFDETDVSDGNMLILPGGMPGTNNLNVHEGLKQAISDYYKQNKYLAAICAAPLILGEMGILRNKKAVCYPGYEDRLLGAIIFGDEKVVVAGKIITSRGAGTAMDFALKLVELLVDKEKSEQLAKALIFA